MAHSVAYTAEEKQILVQLIQRYSIIEEKKTDATSIKRKTEAWDKLSCEFNAIASNTKVRLIIYKAIGVNTISEETELKRQILKYTFFLSSGQ